MWINVRLRNTLFDIINFHGDDWKYELETYKRAVKDSRHM